MPQTATSLRHRPSSPQLASAALHPALLSTLLVCAVLLASVLIAAAPANAKQEQSRIERWKSEVQEIDALQREKGERGARKAERRAEKLFKEVRQRGWREPALKAVLGEIATQLAVADLNRGEDTAKAVWRFHSALLLDPSVAKRDWGAYGRAGRVLAEIEPRVLGANPPGQRALTRPYPRGKRFERPAKGEVKNVVVPLNRAARQERRLLRPTLEVVIHGDGSVSHPAIALGHSSKPTVLLAVLDMVWTMAPFLPARLDGETVDVVYEVSVDSFIFDRWEELVSYH